MINFHAYRFPLADLTLKPGKVSGQSALCLVYADSRAYQDALDAAGVEWQTHVQAIDTKAVVVALSLTVEGQRVTRSATGEDTDLMSAEARAFKRACSAFGLGRYLYNIDLGWQSYDGKRFAQGAYNALNQALAALAPQEVKMLTTSAEAHPWQAWQGPSDAYSWAIGEGAANCDKHARNALKKLVDERFGGAIKVSNWPAIAEAFYHERHLRRVEKASA